MGYVPRFIPVSSLRPGSNRSTGACISIMVMKFLDIVVGLGLDKSCKVYVPKNVVLNLMNGFSLYIGYFGDMD